MDLSDYLKDRIEAILRRQIFPGECGGVNGFKDFSASDMTEINALGQVSVVLAVSYMRYRLREGASLDQAVSYYGSVIQRGLTVDEWLREEQDLRNER